LSARTGSNPFHPSRGPLAAILPLFPCRFQLPIPLGLNLLLMPGEHVPRRDVSDGAAAAQDRTCFHQMPPQNGNFFFRGVVLPLLLSCVRSVILTDERFLHFQLRKAKPAGRTTDISQFASKRIFR
jgi:hypothetical protein